MRRSFRGSRNENYGVETQFTEGDRVRRREGGPLMVVDHVAARLVTCLVVTDEGLRRKVFPAVMLTRSDDNWSVPAIARALPTIE
jgi:uncharacterized protein YodC (DUF2158 family)